MDDPAAKLVTAAQAAALAVIAPAVADAAVKALKSVQPRTQASIADEVAGDFAALRRAADWTIVLTRTQAQAEAVVMEHLSRALRAGYEAQMGEDAETFGLSFEWGASDSRRLARLPITGHTSSEHAKERAQALTFALDGALASPLASGGDPATGVQAIQDAGQAWARGIAALVSDAYHAGTQSAVLAVGELLASETGDSV